MNKDKKEKEMECLIMLSALMMGDNVESMKKGFEFFKKQKKIIDNRDKESS